MDVIKLRKQIQTLCLWCDISISSLARLMDMSPQNFHQKLKRGTLTISDLNRIADVLHVPFQCEFRLSDDMVISLTDTKSKK